MLPFIFVSSSEVKNDFKCFLYFHLEIALYEGKSECEPDLSLLLKTLQQFNR